MTAIEIEVEYADKSNDVPRAVETIILDAGHPEKDYRRVIYAPWDKPYRYRATYVLGNQRSTTPWMEASSATKFVTINTPFDQEFSLQVLASADWKEVSQIIVDLEYADSQSDFRMTNSFGFEKATPQRQAWKFPIRDPNHREFTCTQTMLLANGGVVVSPAQTRKSDAQVLVVGNAPGGVVTIEVDATDTGIGRDVVRVIVRPTYSDPEHNVLDTETLVFRTAETKEWQIARADAAKNRYFYDVEYFMRDGNRRRLSDQQGIITSIRDILVLPPVPAA